MVQKITETFPIKYEFISQKKADEKKVSKNELKQSIIEENYKITVAVIDQDNTTKDQIEKKQEELFSQHILQKLHEIQS
jgi:hypothetical protein